MIYAAFGAPLELTHAEQRTVPSPVKGREDIPGVWFVKAKLVGKFPDGSGRVGAPILDGQWFQASRLTADGGWAEIEDACAKLHSA